MPNSDSFGFDEITTQSTYVVQFNELRNRMINKNLGNVNAKRFFIYPQEGWNKELIETKLELLKNFFKEDGNIAINLFGIGDGFIFFSKNNSFVGHLIFQLELDEEDKWYTNDFRLDPSDSTINHILFNIHYTPNCNLNFFYDCFEDLGFEVNFKELYENEEDTKESSGEMGFGRLAKKA